jgi:hypothetical protein
VRLKDGPRSIVRFDLGFVHELSEGKPRFFAMITEVEGAVVSEAVEDSEGHIDDVLQVPVLHLLTTQRIIGLSRFAADKLYVVSRTGKKNVLDAESIRFQQQGASGQEVDWRDTTDELLLCPWEISFL